MLKVFEKLPEGLLDAPVGQLQKLLGGPSLIHLAGRRSAPLFVSVLTHGNEDTGFYAIQELLRAYRQRELPRALSLFIGNVRAAHQGQRYLDGQPDYNRVWPGTDHADCPEVRMMRQVIDSMQQRQVFASVDIHNNTGINPHYACINRIDNRFLHLAALYSRTVVYFIRPLGVQSMAMSYLCPAVTIECGKPHQEYGVNHARDYIEACLHLSELPQHAVPSHDIELFHTVAIVKIPDNVSFGFADTTADLRLLEAIDHLNFRELPAGTQLGWLRNHSVLPLEVCDDSGRDVRDKYFSLDDDAVVTRCSFMPSMFTLDEKIIRQDCLGYLMERLLPDSEVRE